MCTVFCSGVVVLVTESQEVWNAKKIGKVDVITIMTKSNKSSSFSSECEVLFSSMICHTIVHKISTRL